MPHQHDHHHHAEGHDHHPAGHTHGGADHTHAPAAHSHAAAPAIVLDPPVWSLVRASLVERLGWALGAAALIWAATYLAIRVGP